MQRIVRDVSECRRSAFNRNGDRERLEIRRGDNCALITFCIHKVMLDLRRVCVLSRGIQNYARIVV